MDFTKVDRVNFAFFQPDTDGNLYGTDAWGDPLVLFGPRNYNPAAGATSYCSWDGPLQKNCGHHYYEKGLISLVHAAGGKFVTFQCYTERNLVSLLLSVGLPCFDSSHS